MKMNKVFTVIVLGAALFAGTSYGSELPMSDTGVRPGSYWGMAKEKAGDIYAGAAQRARGMYEGALGYGAAAAGYVSDAIPASVKNWATSFVKTLNANKKKALAAALIALAGAYAYKNPEYATLKMQQLMEQLDYIRGQISDLISQEDLVLRGAVEMGR